MYFGRDHFETLFLVVGKMELKCERETVAGFIKNETKGPGEGREALALFNCRSCDLCVSSDVCLMYKAAKGK